MVQSETVDPGAVNSMAVELDGQIYLMGGTVGGPHLDALEVFNPATGVWKRLAPFPPTDKDDPGRSAASVGVIDGKIHVAGGWRHKPGLPTTSLLIYDPRTDSWEVGPEMPSRSGGSVGESSAENSTFSSEAMGTMASGNFSMPMIPTANRGKNSGRPRGLGIRRLEA